MRGGIEIKLQPGWKTYWRYPGDSGVPPRFDFSGSDNLGRAKVLYPAPHLFTDETGNSLGYKDRGTLEQGKIADFALWDVERPGELAAAIAQNPCLAVVKGGSVVYEAAPIEVRRAQA